MPKRVKNSKQLAGLENNRGQAAIEYVLLLFISVSLVLMLVYQIFKPMQAFMKSFMGDYVSCLLETGELPALSGSDTRAADLGCSAKFNSAGGGKDTPGGGAPGTGSSGSNPNSGKSGGGDGSDSNASSGGGGTYAGSNSRNGRSLMRSPRQGAVGVDGGGQNDKVVEIALDGSGSGGFFRGGSGGGGYARQTNKVTAVGIAGLSEAEKKKLEKKAKEGKNTTVAAGDLAPAPKKIAVKPPEAKREIASEDEPITIGNFIRYLFIAALILALFVFIGGQAVQMSKSGEK